MTKSPQQSVEFVPDAGLAQTLSVQSVALNAELSDASITSVSAAWRDGDAGALLVSPNGSEGAFVAGASAVGASILSGWRYRATLLQQMFDGQALDSVGVTYSNE